MKKVAVIMGSDSDLPVLESCFQTLRKLNIPYEAHVYSAHRTPDAAGTFAASARENGFGVIIAAAGKAAHLAGALAARTVLPVIGIPVKASALEGLDALLSTVQMPGGIPVATVAINGSENAALLAAQILATGDEALALTLEAMRRSLPRTRPSTFDRIRLFDFFKEAIPMKKMEQMYEGKAKKVFATDDPGLVLVDYKDDATAFNGLKKGTIQGKGAINNRVTNHLMKLLEKEGVPTHFVEELSDRETLVKRVSIIPLEVIVRNIAAGSLSKRLGLPEGTKLSKTVLEFCYKDDELGDPMVNRYHIAAMGWATEEEMDLICRYSLKINDVLTAYLKDLNIELIDFKLEFGKTSDGTIVLADEISPDTCRFWDSVTHEKLDKDRFRRDLGGVEDAYHEIMKRLMGE